MFSPRVDVTISSHRVNAYHLLGAGGFVLATAVGLLLTRATERSLPVSLLLALTAAAVFFLLAAGTKLVAGAEYIVYFHHEIAVLASGAALLRVLGVPPLPYLDLTMISILVFLGFGRIGCLMVGCCHGRPAAFGVLYGARHVEAGFPHELAGVTLVPVQAVESLAAFAVAGLGVPLALGGAAGSALAWCVCAYGAGRFFLFEPLRGDRRPSALGLSHAQWVAFVRAGAVLGAIRVGILPFGAAPVVLAAAVCLATAMRAGQASARTSLDGGRWGPTAPRVPSTGRGQR